MTFHITHTAWRSVASTLSAALLLCLLPVSSASAQDPGTPGPLAVTVQEYDFGDTAVTLAGFPGGVEVRASVHRPTNLSAGPFPLVLFLHGRHATCAKGSTAYLQWPCSSGRTPIPSYRGFAYASAILASHGYIVVSISANGLSGLDNMAADFGAQARAELLQHHLDLWRTFTTTGGAPFGSTFIGRVDLTNIGTMGHSRGGEGVMRHVLYNKSLGSPYGIRAVFPLAPTNFNRPIISGVPFEVLLPWCDGDVSDLQGVQFYDDARYAAPGDPAPKHYVLVMGANHNFYNTVWTSGYPGARDDWWNFADPQCGTMAARRLSAAEQRGTGAAYMAGFFRRYLGGETEFDAMLKGDAPAPASARTNDLFSSYHAPDTALHRRDVNRLLDAGDLVSNQLGGAVSKAGMAPHDVCGGEAPQPEHCLTGAAYGQQPHTTAAAVSSKRGLSQLRAGWSSTSAHHTNNMPAGFQDVSRFQVLQFRAAVNFQDARNPLAIAADFTVRLTDGAGKSASTAVSSHSDALFYPPGAAGSIPKVVMNTIRIPLSAFPGVNLSDVRSVQFRFDRASSGALLFTDLAFADANGAPAVADLLTTSLSAPPATAPPGGSFPVTDTVQNPGAAGTEASTTRYYLSLDTTKSGGDVRLTGARAVPALGAGAASTGVVMVTVPAGTALNSYFLIACADDLDVIVESHDGNNCLASATRLEVKATAGLSDLVETAVSNPPATVVVVGTFAVTDTVRNQGGTASGASTTRYYLSRDAIRDSKDTSLVGTRKVSALAAGASATGTATLAIKAGTPADTYFVIACADDKTDVAEGDEANNCRASATKVVVTAPDLVATAVTNPPAGAAAGASFSVTDTTRNQGSAATGGTTTRYYLSLNSTLGSGDHLLGGVRAVPGLAIGATSEGTVTVTVPAGTPANAYFLLACSDDTKGSSEISEKNNCRASQAKVTVQ